jgi:hypothetical protein
VVTKFPLVAGFYALILAVGSLLGIRQLGAGSTVALTERTEAVLKRLNVTAAIDATKSLAIYQKETTSETADECAG